MSSNPTPRSQGRQRHVSRLRRDMAKLGAVAVAAFAIGAVGQAVPEPMYAALFAVLSGVALCFLVAVFIVVMFAGSYADDRQSVMSRTRGLMPYVLRSGKYGLAAAGVGALLATALPARLSAAVDANPSALPVAGWVAIFFGATGVAVGILEEWHGQLPGAGGGSRHGDQEPGS